MKIHLFTGALFGAVALILAAFFQHGVILDTNDQQRITLALHYQQWHAVMLVFVGFSSYFALPSVIFKRLCWCGHIWSLGCVLFSGSLYAGVLTQWPYFFKLTPTGGSMLIIGWFVLLSIVFIKPIIKMEFQQKLH